MKAIVKKMMQTMKTRLIIMDGGFGPELFKRGALLSDDYWSAVHVEYPEITQSIHEDFIKNGAEILITNTFKCNKNTFGAVGQEDKADFAVRKACELAKNARDKIKHPDGRDVLIAGSMSIHPPVVKHATISESIKNMSHVLAYDNFPSKEKELDNWRHLANTLKEEGCDFIVTEMMMEDYHSSLLLQAASESELPFIVGVTCRLENGKP